MVFLAITRAGFEAHVALGSSAGPLWVSAEVLSESELAALRKSGVEVSDFNYKIEPHENEVIAGAVETIKEHHPRQVVWVEL
jgi:hypothetical protein